jgi:hypothetical protein
MKAKGTHMGTSLLTYERQTSRTMRAHLLASQITGALHMLMRTCGEFPLSEEQRKPENKAKFEQILKDLNYPSPKVGGGFLEDSPGMGKTLTTLAFFDWWSRHASHVDEIDRTCYRPTMLLTPDGHVLRQWAETINKDFPGIKLIVVKPGEDWDDWNEDEFKAIRFDYVDRSAIVRPETHWPPGLDYVWNVTDKRAARVIIVAPYSTMRSRLVQTEKHTDAAAEVYPDAKPENWCYNRKKKQWESYDVPRFWLRKLAMALLDEGHIARNDKRQLHWVLRGLQARVNWYLSATPMVNSPNVSIFQFSDFYRLLTAYIIGHRC